MTKKEILKELEKQFKLTQERLGFKASFEEINSISYIEDMVLSQGFVSNQFSRQMTNRMVETFNGWLGELYSWVFPPSHDIIKVSENKKIDVEERKEIISMIDRIMYLVRKNKRIAFEGLIEKEEGEFIDELVEFDKKYFNPFMLKFHKKFETLWEKEFSE